MVNRWALNNFSDFEVSEVKMEVKIWMEPKRCERCAPFGVGL